MYDDVAFEYMRRKKTQIISQWERKRRQRVDPGDEGKKHINIPFVSLT